MKKILFTGFMASILTIAGAYAANPADTTGTELTTKSYVDGAALWAKGAADGVQNNLNTHIADSVKHITAAERAEWNEAATLAGTALQSANLDGYATEEYVSTSYVAKEEGKSLISSTDLAQIGTNKTDIENLQAAAGNYATGDDLSALAETVAGHTTAISGLDADLNTAETDIDNLQASVTTAEGEIDDLQATVGDSTSGLVKDVADLQTTVGAIVDTWNALDLDNTTGA